MIQRIALLFIITGAGHILSILSLRFLALTADSKQVAGMAEFESLIQLIIGLVGFGMQSEAIRNISLNDKWKEKFEQAQTSRLTLSIILSSLVVLSFSNKFYMCFLIAPLFAMNGDYALYARGLSFAGTFIAFIRVVFPLLLGVVSLHYWPHFLLEIYVAATIVIYLITNLLIASLLEVSLLFRPSLGSLLLYVKTIPLGIISLSFYFFGLGFILFAKFFFDEKDMVVLFVAMKFYLIYKGAIRVIHQAFIGQMTVEEICLSIDKISMMLGFLFLGSVIIFPVTFISIFFGSQFIHNQFFFVYLSISALIFGVFGSATTRVILERHDLKFMKVSIAAVLVSIVCLLVIVQFSLKVEVAILSLLLGELFFAIMSAFLFFRRSAILSRISFMLIGLLGLVFPYTSWLVFGQNVVSYFVSITLLGLFLLPFINRNFKLAKIKTKDFEK